MCLNTTKLLVVEIADILFPMRMTSKTRASVTYSTLRMVAKCLQNRIGIVGTEVRKDNKVRREQMAKGNPQVENGYTKIANELIEALSSAKLNGSEFKVVLAIIRKTYGYNSKVKDISLVELTEATGLNHKAVSRTLNALKARRIIFRNNSRTGINKHYKEWLGSVKSDTVKLDTVKTDTGNSVKFDTVGSVKGDTAPIHYIKENIKENKKKPAAHSQTLKKAASQQNDDATQYRDATQYDDEPYETYLEELTRKGVTIIRHKDSGGGLPF